MKRLYFVRHGLSELNVAGHYSGHTNTPLTAKGKAQATSEGKKARDQGLVFDIILASPLDRAHETARRIASEIEYPHENIVLHDGLKERYFGELENKPSSVSGVSYEEYMNNPFALDHFKDIEKITDLQFRANNILEEIKQLPHEHILIVSHGAFGRALYRAYYNLPITDFGRQFENAEIVHFI
jgi:broad specificity phosphatase PhoE